MRRMNPLTPEHALVVLNAVVLPMLQAEHPLTGRVIAAIPNGKGDYRPDDVGRSALDLAWHIVSAENRFLEAVASGAFDLTPLPRPDTVRTAADVNAWYAPRFSTLVNRLKQLSGEQLTRTIDFRGIFQLPAIAYANLAVNHTVHHQAIIGVLLGIQGHTVPDRFGHSPSTPRRH